MPELSGRSDPTNGAVAVFGSGGLLGYSVVSHLRRGEHRVIAVGRANRNQCDQVADVATLDGPELTALLASFGSGALVLNAAGVLRGKPLDDRGWGHMAAVNSAWPRRLAAATAELGHRLIHVSSDAVFPALAGDVDEEAAPQPEDLYGCSKYIGEPESPSALTLRCSFVGPDHRKERGLISWVLQQPRAAEVSGFEDQLWTGVTTLQLAVLVELLIEEDQFKKLRAEGSVHHICPNASLTKYELVAAIARALRPDLTVQPAVSGRTVTRTLKTKRSATSLLAKKAPAEWEALIRETVEEW